MGGNGKQLAVQIVRFVDEGFPGWVACEFLDANARRHTIVDKVPIFTTEFLDSSSEYPRPGSMSCEVVRSLEDENRRQLACVRSIGMESTEGVSEFIIEVAQLSELAN